MNDKQKIFIVVGIVSLVIALATGYDSMQGWSSAFSDSSSFFTKITRVKAGYLPNDWKLEYRTNWPAIFGLGIATGCAIGLFLFKDKK